MRLGAPHLLIHIPCNVSVWMDMDLSLRFKHAENAEYLSSACRCGIPSNYITSIQSSSPLSTYGEKLEVAVAVCEKVCKHNFEYL
jgi:hypothetical protein